MAGSPRHHRVPPRPRSPREGGPPPDPAGRATFWGVERVYATRGMACSDLSTPARSILSTVCSCARTLVHSCTHRHPAVAVQAVCSHLSRRRQSSWIRRPATSVCVQSPSFSTQPRGWRVRRLDVRSHVHPLGTNSSFKWPLGGSGLPNGHGSPPFVHGPATVSGGRQVAPGPHTVCE